MLRKTSVWSKNSNDSIEPHPAHLPLRLSAPRTCLPPPQPLSGRRRPFAPLGPAAAARLATAAPHFSSFTASRKHGLTTRLPSPLFCPSGSATAVVEHNWDQKKIWGCCCEL